MPSKEAKHGEKQHRHICPTFWAHFTSGRLLLLVIVVFTMAVFIELEQHAKDAAIRADAATDVCNRQCHTPMPPFFRGTGEVSPKNEGTNRQGQYFRSALVQLA